MPLSTKPENSHNKEIPATLKNNINVRNAIYIKYYCIKKFILMKISKRNDSEMKEFNAKADSFFFFSKVHYPRLFKEFL